jgi:hypothetical protein
MSLNGTYYRKYEGQAFYRKKKEVKKFAVIGRVMIDAATFREKNPNYFFPRIDVKPFEDDPDFSRDDDSYFEDKSGNDRVVTKRKVFCSPEESLLCSETVYGFCFSTKLWGQYMSSTQYNKRLTDHCDVQPSFQLMTSMRSPGILRHSIPLRFRERGKRWFKHLLSVARARTPRTAFNFAT